MAGSAAMIWPRSCSRIGFGPKVAVSWLTLAELYERQTRCDEAENIYRLLLAEDPFLSAAQAGLERVTGVNID